MEKACKQCGMTKTFDNFYVNKNLKDGHFNVCKPCVKIRSGKWYSNNKERKLATSRAWKLENADRYKAWCSRYYQENRERCNFLTNEWWRRHPERRKEKGDRWSRQNRHKRLAATLQYQKVNAGRLNAKRAKRKALKLSATPTWADAAAIDQYYLIAKYLSDELGVKFHVDHVVPLQSEIVCGLHAHTNLTISVGSWNCSKSNKWWPEMP
jgi:hypothetical protein